MKLKAILKLQLHFMLRKVYRGFKSLFGPKPMIRQNDGSIQWYGTQYGGFYVKKDLIGPQSIVYSFGIGEDISFDLEVIERHGCRVFAFDPTPRSIQWIGQQSLPAQFQFYGYGLHTETGEVTFNLPRNKKHVSGSVVDIETLDSSNSIKVPMRSFADIIAEMRHDKIDVLKIDIEGSEFSVIESILSSGVDITQILIEEHQRFFPDGAEKLKQLFELFTLNNYLLFASSPSGQELSFVKVV